MTSGRRGHDGGQAGDQHVVFASADRWGFVTLRQPATPRQERYAIGRSLRKQVPRSTLGTWSVPDSRTDPVQQIIATPQGRLDRLIPVRIGRMIASPYALTQLLRTALIYHRGGLRARRYTNHRSGPSSDRSIS
jgi:hypothetical protein